MSSQLGEAFVPIRATLDKLDKDLEGARGKILGAMDRIGKNVQSAGKAALAGLVGLGGAAIAAAGGMAMLAASAEPLVGLQQGFAAVTERIGTSSSVMLSALQDASGGLITNRDLMTSFNKAAALVSDDFASKLPDAMSLVRKASQATGQDMGFLFDSLVTGVGRVSPMILDNLGIQISLAEVTEHAAEMFGKQASELSKTEQQAALTEIVMAKLNDTYGDVPDTSMTFAKVGVAIANLKDEIALKLLPVFVPLVEKLLEAGQKAIPVLLSALDRVLPVIESVVTVIGNFVSQLMNGIDPITAIVWSITQLMFAFGATSQQVQAVNNSVWPLIQSLRSLWDQILVFLQPFIQWVQQNVQLKDVLIALGIVIASVVIPAIIGIISAIAPVILTFAAIVAAVALLRQAWEENFLGIQEFVATALATIQTVISTALLTIQTWWAAHGEEVIQTVTTFLTNAWTTIQTVFETVKTFISDALATIQAWWAEHGEEVKRRVSDFMTGAWTTIQNVFNTVKTFVSEALATIKAWWAEHGEEVKRRVSDFMTGAWTTIQNVFEAIKGFISTALANIQAWWAEHGAGIIATVTNYLTIVKTFVETVLTAISDFWNTHGQQIMEFAKSAWETIQEIVNYVLTFIQELINAVAAVIEGDWKSFGASLERIWSTLWETIKSILSTAWEGIKTLLSIGLDALVSLVSGIGSRMYAAGQAIIDQLKQGLQNKLNEVKGWFQDRLNDLRDMLPFSEPKDPSSPFRGLGKSGEAIVDNLLTGMQRAFPAVTDWFESTLAPQFDLERMLPVMGLAGSEMVPAGSSISYSSETTVYTDRDPLRVLRASRHLDKLGTVL